jgi:hypothetical protein
VRRPVLVGAAVLLATTALAGCGGHEDKTATVEGASMATVRTARCDDWNAMTPTQRDRLIVGMRTFFGGVVDQPGMRGQVMPADKARKVFDGFCKESFAGRFTLYRLYGDAAAFTPAKVKAQAD